VRCRPRPLTAFALFALCVVCPSAQTTSGHSLPQITTIEAIRSLSQDESAKGYPVRVRGIVTHFDERSGTGLIVHDGAFGQFVMPPDDLAAIPAWRTLKRGDLVEIEGQTTRGGFAPNIAPDGIRRLGTGAVPRPKQISFASMLTGRFDCDYVEVEGVVQRAWSSPDPNMQTLFADVAVDEGVLRASFWDYTERDRERLIDARVRLRGNIGTLFGRSEQLRGVSLFVGRASDVTVLEAQPNPVSMPLRTIGSIYNYSAAGEAKRRIRIRGVVTAYVPGRPVEVTDFTSTATFRYVSHVMYVHDGSGGARIETEQPGPVRPGTVVEVAGFPAVTPGKPILTNAVYRVDGEAPQPAPVPVEAGNVLAPDHDATVVRMQGLFLSTLTNSTGRVLVLGEAVFPASLDTATVPESLARITPGSVVSVTGVYAYQWGPPPTFGLVLRSADDVTLVQAAPWWTLRHTGVTVALLGLAVAGAGFWIRASETRKRQQYQAVLNERMRLGRELHDTLEQGLAGIALQLEAVSGVLETSPDAARHSLEVARQMLRYSQEEARRSVMDLRSQALERGDLPTALGDLARQMTRGTPAAVDVQVEGSVQRMDASVEHHLLRIGLEALTNALKHSGARRVLILLRFESGAVGLVVQDDGRGFDPGQRSGEDHFGLRGIRERVDKLAGSLRIDSREGGGTRLAVTIPSRTPVAGRSLEALDESWRTV
jgi:signal transduction histidine kinase